MEPLLSVLRIIRRCYTYMSARREEICSQRSHAAENLPCAGKMHILFRAHYLRTTWSWHGWTCLARRSLLCPEENQSQDEFGENLEKGTYWYLKSFYMCQPRPAWSRSPACRLWFTVCTRVTCVKFWLMRHYWPRPFTCRNATCSFIPRLFPMHEKLLHNNESWE